VVAAGSSVLVNNPALRLPSAAASGVFSAGSEEHREVSARRVYLVFTRCASTVAVSRTVGCAVFKARSEA